MQSAFAARTMVDMYDICGTSLNGTQLLSDEAASWAARLGLQGSPEAIDRTLQDLSLGSDHLLQPLCRLYARSTVDLTRSAPWLECRRLHGTKIQATREQTAIDRADKAGRWAPEGYKFSTSNPLEDEWVSTIAGVWHHESPSFFTDANLAYAGTAILELESKAEDIGIGLANVSMSVLCMAHLYVSV
jgi:hypothetical protein